MAAIELKNPPRDIVQEVTVMGNRHNSAIEVVQEVFKPGNRISVKMVGRLVK